MSWTHVTKQEAERIAYYGVSGWLLALVIGSGAFAVVSLAAVAITVGTEKTFGGPQIAWTAWAALGVLFVGLAVSQHRLTQLAGLLFVWAVLIEWFIVGTLTDRPSALGAGLLLCVIFGTPLTWYVVRSKRMNVTFRHRIRTENGSSAKSVDTPGPPDP